MLRKALFIGLTLGSGLAGTLAATAAGPFFAEPPTTPGQPFSAVAQTQSTTVFADGNRIVRNNTVHYYRDGQGRTRVERDANPAAIGEASSGSKSGGAVMAATTVIEIEDPVTGERIHLIPQAKMATVLKLPQGAKMGHAVLASPFDMTAPFGLLGFGMGIGANGMTTESSADTTSLGQKVVDGILATGTRIVRTIPVGVLGNEKPITSTLEEWKSAELGIPVQIIEQSSIGGRLIYDLQDVQETEPDPSLFTVPSNYTRHDLNTQTLSGTTTSTATFTAVKKP
jgi:hypothetical protein